MKFDMRRSGRRGERTKKRGKHAYCDAVDACAEASLPLRGRDGDHLRVLEGPESEAGKGVARLAVVVDRPIVPLRRLVRSPASLILKSARNPLEEARSRL